MKSSRLVLAIALIFGQLPQMGLPAGINAWVVQVSTTGGFSGSGTGDIAVSSQGRILCSSPAMHCAKSFTASTLQPLIETIPPRTVTIAGRSTTGMCNDCVSRTIVITRRDNRGSVHTYTASWNDLSQGAVPQDVIKLYESVLKVVR